MFNPPKANEFHCACSTRRGTRFRMLNGRPVVSTSLGDPVLDSGADRLALFGVQSDIGCGLEHELGTVTGSKQIGTVFSKPLIIEGRRILASSRRRAPEQIRAGWTACCR